MPLREVADRVDLVAAQAWSKGLADDLDGNVLPAGRLQRASTVINRPWADDHISSNSPPPTRLPIKRFGRIAAQLGRRGG